MDINKLFQSCKNGDLRKIKYLFSHKDVDPNLKDSFDSTPLYYACLCGHYDVVEFLLQNGAKCEMNTFQGERCLYGALTTSIKNLLRNYKIVTSNCMRRDPYQEFLRKVYENETCADIMLNIINQTLECKNIISEKQTDIKSIENSNEHTLMSHKCILAARSWFFYNLFLNCASLTKVNEENEKNIDIKMPSPQCLTKILRYLYLGEFNIELKEVDDILELTSALHLDHLHKQVLYKKMLFGYQLDLHDFDYNSSKKTSRKQRTHSLLNHSSDKMPKKTSRKRKYKKCPSQSLILAVDDESEIERLKSNMGMLLKHINCKNGQSPEKAVPLADVKFIVENTSFYCHKVFFVGRSEYFRALLEDPFAEKNDSTILTKVPENESSLDLLPSNRHLPAFTLTHLTPQVFSHVIRYLYQDWSNIEVEIVFEVLQAADQFLLPGLKKVCATIMATNLEVENVVNLLLASRTYDLSNLEDACAQYICNHLPQMTARDDFRGIVVSDAAQVLNRQETDSISIVDDVRYYITNHVQTFESMRQAQIKLHLLDQLLTELGLEA